MLVTVYGDIRTVDGKPVSGVVQFTPRSLPNESNTTVTSGTITARIKNGILAVPLYVTPKEEGGVTYDVKEQFGTKRSWTQTLTTEMVDAANVIQYTTLGP